MKKLFALLAIFSSFASFSSMGAISKTEYYKNRDGCVVSTYSYLNFEHKKVRNFHVVYTGKDGLELQDGIVYLEDGSYGALGYCNDVKSDKKFQEEQESF
jgi:hypothetical protein